jgi:hypothetical protein
VQRISAGRQARAIEWAAVAALALAAVSATSAAPQAAGQLRQGDRRPPAALPANVSLRDVAADADPLPPNDRLAAVALEQRTIDAVAALDARSYAERRTASEALASIETPVDQLLSVLARGGLSSEQQHRVLAIAVDRIINAPRGALGIQMARRGFGGEQGDGVRIARVIPGFPAEKLLQVDDLIVAIEGRAVRSSEDLIEIVQGLPPGTTVRVEAVRADRDERGKQKLDAEGAPITVRVDVQVKLGSKRDLDASEPMQGGLGSDPLDLARQEFARSVLRRFSQEPLIATLPDDAALAAQFAARSPDSHEIVQQLLRELEDRRLQQRPLEGTQLGWFRRQSIAIRRMSEDPTYAEAERGWFRRVADRLDELLPKDD